MFLRNPRVEPRRRVCRLARYNRAGVFCPSRDGTVGYRAAAGRLVEARIVKEIPSVTPPGMGGFFNADKRWTSRRQRGGVDPALFVSVVIWNEKESMVPGEQPDRQELRQSL